MSGNLKPAEIKPLIMAARAAYDFQAKIGNLDSLEDFDSWRREQCQIAVGRSGLTDCMHADFKPLLAHFQVLSGKHPEAFKNLMSTGRPKVSADAEDTYENRRVLAHQIAQAMERHTAAGGKIGVGYIVAIARHKTRRPTLTLGNDWQAGLVERLDVNQLRQLRNTVINRISAAEGNGPAEGRNKSQRNTKKPPTKFNPNGKF